MADSYYEIKRRCTDLYAKYPFLNYQILGRSHLGRDIFSLSIGCNENRTLILSSPKANSKSSPNLLVNFLDELCFSIYKGSDMAGLNIRRALKDKGVTVIPFFNPDGYDFVISGDKSLPKGAKPAAELSKINKEDLVTNIGGVDLYYNFLKRNPTVPFKRGFSGYSPLSEPESVTIAEFCRKNTVEKLVLIESGENAIGYFPDAKDSEKISQILSAASLMPRYKLCDTSGFLYWYRSKINGNAFMLNINDDYARLREALVLVSIM